MTTNTHKDADHVHSDPTTSWRDVVGAVDASRREWDNYVIGFSPNVDGVDAPTDPDVDDSAGPILPNTSNDAAEEIAFLIRQHTAARGIDLWAVDVIGYSAAEWARMTGRDRSTVARNVRRGSE